MILAELVTLSLYIGSMVLLPEYFGMSLAFFRYQGWLTSLQFETSHL